MQGGIDLRMDRGSTSYTTSRLCMYKQKRFLQTRHAMFRIVFFSRLKKEVDTYASMDLMYARWVSVGDLNYVYKALPRWYHVRFWKYWSLHPSIYSFISCLPGRLYTTPTPTALTSFFKSPPWKYLPLSCLLWPLPRFRASLPGPLQNWSQLMCLSILGLIVIFDVYLCWLEWMGASATRGGDYCFRFVTLRVCADFNLRGKCEQVTTRQYYYREYICTFHCSPLFHSLFICKETI